MKPQHSWFFLLSFIALFGCSPTEQESLTKISGSTMGTSYHITLASSADVDALKSQVDARLESFDKIFSTWRADSEISKFNQSESIDWHKVTDTLFYVLSVAERIHKETDGAFDITLRPLINLWGFGANPSPVEPSAEAVLSVLEKTRCLQLKMPNQIRKTHAECEIDLSAVAKGYGVDVISTLLKDKGYANHLVEIGGEVYAAGDKYGQAWTLASENPKNPMLAAKTFTVKNQGVATSGDYRNYREDKHGKRITHIIDPRSGYPIEHKTAAVTVIAQTCMEADAYATALMVLGKEPHNTRIEKVFFSTP